MVRKRGLLSAVTVSFLVNLRKTKAKQRLGKRAILPEAPCPGKQNRPHLSPHPLTAQKESAKVAA
jgi:hypothetical protein